MIEFSYSANAHLPGLTAVVWIWGQRMQHRRQQCETWIGSAFESGLRPSANSGKHMPPCLHNNPRSRQGIVLDAARMTLLDCLDAMHALRGSHADRGSAVWLTVRRFDGPSA